MNTKNKSILTSAKECSAAFWLICIATLWAISGCASIQGFPDDPEDASKSLKSLSPYYDGTEEDSYNAIANNPVSRAAKRNEIVFAMMRGYDLEFAKFVKQLYGTSNSISVGTDLVGLALGGLTATVGGVGTKAALGAASIGVLGANTAINKDLFFQKTIPALIAQMEANRSKAALVIFKGIEKPDNSYPLGMAYRDLYTYKVAGSIGDAISSITQTAVTDKKSADAAMVIHRTSADIEMLPDRNKILASLKELNGDQMLAVAAEMSPKLSERTVEFQAWINGDDKDNARLKDKDMAKNIMFAWANEDVLTPAFIKEWTDAISNAKKKGK